MALAKDIKLGLPVVTRDGRTGRIVRASGNAPKGFAFVEFNGAAPVLVSISTLEAKA